MKNLLLLLGVVLMFACTGAQQDELVTVQVSVDENNSAELLENVQIKRISALDNSHPMGDIWKAEILGNDIFLYNRQAEEVVCVANNGKFKFKVGTQGRGPEEYAKLQSFYVGKAANEVNIVAMNNQIVKHNAATGEFKGLEPLEFDTFMTLDAIRTNNGDLVVYTCGPNYNLEVFKPGLDTSIKYIPFIELRDFSFSFRAFSNIEEYPAFAHGASDYIYNIYPDRVSPKYFIDFGACSIDPDWYTSNPAAVERAYQARKIATKLDDLIETKDYLSFSYMVFVPGGGLNFKKQYVLYDKASGELKNLPAELPLFPILNCDNDLLLSVVSISAIEDCKGNAPALEQLREYIKENSLDIESNSLMVWWKMKN